MSKPEKAVGILACFTPDSRAAFEQFAQRRDFRKDDQLLAAHRHNASLFIITNGLVHARLDMQGGDTLLARLGPGNFFGEVSVFDPGETSARVVAVTDGSLLEIDRNSLRRFIEQHPAAGSNFLMRLVQEIARRIRRSDERLGDAVLLNRMLDA